MRRQAAGQNAGECSVSTATHPPETSGHSWRHMSMDALACDAAQSARPDDVSETSDWFESELLDLSNDQVLMAFADGQLAESKRQLVQHYLEQNDRARQVVHGVWQLGDWITEHVNDQTDGVLEEQIVTAVMDKLRQQRVLAEPTEQDISQQKQVVVLNEWKEEKSKETSPRTHKPHSVAGLWAIGLGVVSAAAGVMLLLWTGVFAPVNQASTGSLEEAPLKHVAPFSKGEDIAETEEDLVPTVAINAIDFGSRTGTVFYVPNERGHTTTVVWVTDEESGGD